MKVRVILAHIANCLWPTLWALRTTKSHPFDDPRFRDWYDNHRDTQ